MLSSDWSFGLFILCIIISMFGAVVNLPNKRSDPVWPVLVYMLSAVLFTIMACLNIIIDQQRAL